MSSQNIYSHLVIDIQSVTPKYIQLVNAILKAVEEGKLTKDYLLPSINELSYELDISRDTAEKAYRHLKDLKVIGSVPGKGYFILKTDIRQDIKVLLIFNKLSVHKKIIYDALINTLGNHAAIDFYIYNNDFGLFKKILLERLGKYTHFVIIPHFLEGGEKAFEVLNEIKNGKLILLDKLIGGIKGNYGAVYENFEKDIFEALQSALPQLSKYHTLKLMFPDYTYFPKEILKGFENFCIEYAFPYKVVQKVKEETIEPGDVYINMMEDDLILLLEKIKETKLQVGKDIGIISYNETPWKRFILDGITTISSDFYKMGEVTAQMILNNEQAHIEIPFALSYRQSL
jgi:DNA-binding transcriptional regulator YhcF (GntR family)